MTYRLEDPSITQKKMASRVGLTSDGVKFHINKLKEKGYIRHEGPMLPPLGFMESLYRWKDAKVVLTVSVLRQAQDER